jgi:TonB family protein
MNSFGSSRAKQRVQTLRDLRLALLLLPFFVPLLAGQERTGAPDGVERGHLAYQKGRYKEAVQDFERAVAQDPSNLQAVLGLASAYMAQWIPGLPSPENQQNLSKAREDLERALQLDPENRRALSSLANLAYLESGQLADEELKAKKLTEARDLYRRLSDIDSGDKESFYMQGVIAWSGEFPALQRARKASGLPVDQAGPIPDLAKRRDMLKSFGASIDEGIENLNKAIQIDPGYVDAMSYMNLLLRDRALLRDTQAQSDQDVAEAEYWSRRGLEARELQTAASANILPASPAPARASPEPPPPPLLPEPREFTVGDHLGEGKLIRGVQPSYPPEARAAGVHGIVEFTAHIAADGTIGRLDVVRGDPLLLKAAREAVIQWRYRPTLLNGQPVAIVTNIVVNFTLSQ